MVCPIPTCEIAQKINFHLQDDGTFSLATGFEYGIVTDSMSKKELFDKVMRNIMKLYVSPKDVVSTMENEMISINAIAFNAVTVKEFKFFNILYSLHYKLLFQFEDGEIRVFKPHVNRVFSNLDDYGIMNFDSWLKAEKIVRNDALNEKKQKNIDDINNFINGVINNIINIEPSNE